MEYVIKAGNNPVNTRLVFIAYSRQAKKFNVLKEARSNSKGTEI